MKKFILFFLVSIYAQAQISGVERNALIGIYNNTQGSSWTSKTNWDTNASGTSDVNTWYGITTQNISGVEYVTEIDLSNNNLNGTLPDLSAFTRLSSLKLSQNLLTGSLDLSSLNFLSEVVLNHNSFDFIKLGSAVSVGSFNVKDNANLSCLTGLY